MEANIRVRQVQTSASWPQQQAISHLVQIRCSQGKNDAALRILGPALEQARDGIRALDDPKTLYLLTYRIELLSILGDLAEARSSAEEVLASRTRKLGPGRPLHPFGSLRNLALIRRDQGAIAEAGKLFAQLREQAKKDLAMVKAKRFDPDQALNLHRQIAFAEVLARNLSRPERSNAAPGTPGGPPKNEPPYPRPARFVAH